MHERSYIWTAEKSMKTSMIYYRSDKHNLNDCGKRDWKNTTLNGIRTHDLCNSSAVLHQLRYQANRELVMLWGRNIPVDDEDIKWIII